MPKDLREMLQKDLISEGQLSNNHRKKFENKLQKELHTNKFKKYQFFKIAASFLMVIGLGSSLFYFSNNSTKTIDNVAKIESLGSISPELKKIENYYLASIRTEISTIQETPENRELLNGYFEKLGELTKEYKVLTEELNSGGLNEKSINALIENLQLRLKLLYQLKEQLNDLQKLNKTENENVQV